MSPLNQSRLLKLVNYIIKIKDVIKHFDRKPIFMVFCSASVSNFHVLKLNSVLPISHDDLNKLFYSANQISSEGDVIISLH